MQIIEYINQGATNNQDHKNAAGIFGAGISHNTLVGFRGNKQNQTNAQNHDKIDR